MAEHAHLSIRQFARRFTEETGTTPHRWLMAERVLRARDLLETTPLSIDEVAAHSGFRTSASLRQHFRRELALSPSDYRRNFQGRPPASAS